jgi:uncharacterized protein (AIM24 family)
VNPPKLRDQGPTAETAAGVSYRVIGTALEIQLAEHAIFAPNTCVTWRSPSVELALKPGSRPQMGKSAGGDLAYAAFLVETRAAGVIGLSRSGIGKPFAIHLPPGGRIDVRQDSLLAATANVHYTWQEMERSQTAWGGARYIDTFWTTDAPGIVWLQSDGDVLEATLADGDALDVFGDCWLYKDASVGVITGSQTFGEAAGLAQSYTLTARLVGQRFTGPGRLAWQTYVDSDLSTSL